MRDIPVFPRDSSHKTAVQCDGCKGSLQVACIGLSKNDYIRVIRHKTRVLRIMCFNGNSNIDQMLNI